MVSCHLGPNHRTAAGHAGVLRARDSGLNGMWGCAERTEVATKIRVGAAHNASGLSSQRRIAVTLTNGEYEMLAMVEEMRPMSEGQRFAAKSRRVIRRRLGAPVEDLNVQIGEV